MEIKTSAESSSDVIGHSFTDDGEFTPVIASSVDSDIYNDLLLVESKIKELHGEGVLSDKDLRLLNTFSWNPSTMKLEIETGIPSETFNSRFSKICNVIATHLGGIFTDKGYLDFMKEKYNLSNDQINTLKKYMSSSIKHKIARRIFQ